MEKKTENIHPDEWLKDIQQTIEVESFKPEEMTACPKCNRTSPPTRTNCFYCGADLPVTEAQSKFFKPNLRRLEAWEKGFNVISSPIADGADVGEIARLLGFEVEDIRATIATGKSVPIARLESAAEAGILIEKLKAAGVIAVIVSDETLHLETPQRRLRGIEFSDDKIIFILFNADEIAEVAAADISLIVAGALFERKIEATESIKAKKETKVLDSAEVTSDEAFVDIYLDRDDIGYRIESKGFDFSCLGEAKTLLAKDNMQILIGKLRETAPEAVFDNDYRTLRAELGRVWDVDQRSDPGFMDRKALSGMQRKNVTTISNLSQFLRYSRVRHKSGGEGVNKSGGEREKGRKGSRQVDL